MVSRIFLYGPSGAGKTTAGLILSSQLALPFIDLDRLIETETGKSIEQLFEEEDETHFRQVEGSILTRLIANQPNGVIALGGGALLDPKKREEVEGAGLVVCMRAGAEKLIERLRDDRIPRPLLAGEFGPAVRNYLKKREPHYASFSHQLDTSDLNPEGAAKELQILLGAFHLSGGKHGYDIRIADHSLLTLGDLLLERDLQGPIGLVTDDRVGPLYAQGVVERLERAGYRVQTVTIPAGELNKNLDTTRQVWGELLAGGIERGGTVLALGGGVVGDLGGFAAATYLRGVAWVVLPTTLLAMVDASLGAKTGIDMPQGKNLVGAFHPPRLVLADPTVLSTLADSEIISGMAEVVKHGVISDPYLFERCAGALDRKKIRTLIPRAVAVKVGIVAGDPLEGGRREALNFGHTIGHGVEHASGFRLSHGEAIAIGMVAETRMAERIGLAVHGLTDRISAVLKSIGLPVTMPASIDPAGIPRTMKLDKKRSQGDLQFSLPVDIGEVRVGQRVDGWETLLPELLDRSI